MGLYDETLVSDCARCNCLILFDRVVAPYGMHWHAPPRRKFRAREDGKNEKKLLRQAADENAAQAYAKLKAKTGQLDAILEKQTVRLRNMKKTQHPQNQKYLCADAEAKMASALDFMHAEA